MEVFTQITIYNPKATVNTYRLMHRRDGYQFNVTTDDKARWLQNWLVFRQKISQSQNYYLELLTDDDITNNETDFEPIEPIQDNY